MAMSRVERIRQEREELIREMEGNNKSPKDFKKILVPLIAVVITSVVVLFGIKVLMDDKVESSSKKENKSELPVINFENAFEEITAGDSFDLLSGISLEDNKDSEAKLKKQLEISSTPEFDANKEGIYKIVYKVTDSDKHSVKKIREIAVKSSTENEKPSILVESSYVEIEAGTTYDLKEGLSIVSGDQSLLNQIKVTSTPVFDKNKVGEYTIKFSVEDANGNKLEASKKIVVKAKTTASTNTNTNSGNTTSGNSSTDKESPMLLLDSLEGSITVGTNIDLKSAVTKTTDNVDANHVVLATLKITSSPVFNSNKPGIYRVSYTVNDKAGNTRTKVKTITVK
ncbi:MAG: hypothetical protein K0R71_384 [Bacillales bacterium]|jgi:methionine-rich copper-binding protein CopC|nr:hypothetical protein [Bacillales bacterium]